MRSLKMKLNRGNIVLCKVQMPSEKLREFKLRLDFIINYDIKYRMGKALFGEDDEEAEDE